MQPLVSRFIEFVGAFPIPAPSPLRVGGFLLYSGHQMPENRLSRRKDTMNRLTRLLMLAGAWTACVVGCIGVFVPVLPTTPLLLLATFLFAKSSPRCHAWIVSTRVYRTYVAAFKEAGGIPIGTKARILAVSFALMGLSAWFVQKPLVWAILGCVSAFLLYLMIVRIPTIGVERVQRVRRAEEEG